MKKAFFSLMIAWLVACAPAPAVVPAATRTPAANSGPTALPISETAPETEGSLLVAFVKNGDIYVWDSKTGESRIIVKAGDVTTVTISDDGQVIAFARRSIVQLAEPDWYEQHALWAVDRDGGNLRELVSIDTLRQLLNPSATDSTGFAPISWIPGTHRLIYSGVKYNAAGQGFTNSNDIYLVDADSGADTVLAFDVVPDRFLNAWHIVISPDGQQIALISSTALSFINVDGSNWRQGVLTYSWVGAGDAVVLPRGVWTEDSSAFVFTGPIESDSPFVLNYTIWRVPADGSPAQSLVTITNSNSDSLTFSPDGDRMAFFQDINGDGTFQVEDHRIMPLAADVGPLTIPFSHGLWSPGGEAFVVKDQELFQLCSEATNATEICGDPILLASGSALVDRIEWVDEDRFLYLVVEPTTLSLGRLDGTIMPIVTLKVGESLDAWSFHAPD
jgi:Tol biopolymer transport system component